MGFLDRHTAGVICFFGRGRAVSPIRWGNLGVYSSRCRLNDHSWIRTEIDRRSRGFLIDLIEREPLQAVFLEVNYLGGPLRTLAQILNDN